MKVTGPPFLRPLPPFFNLSVLSLSILCNSIQYFADADMLENIEIGEQKQRDEAYKASKKKGTYDDK
jgi:hypothetical protein